jgi:hypothetical protein
VSFDGYPAEALVRIGGEQRAVAETKARPFRVVAPPEGLKVMRYAVRYEVVLAGKTIDSGERAVEPGRDLVVEPKGSP